jgi:hypothetical protein
MRVSLPAASQYHTLKENGKKGLKVDAKGFLLPGPERMFFCVSETASQ